MDEEPPSTGVRMSLVSGVSLVSRIPEGNHEGVMKMAMECIGLTLPPPTPPWLVSQLHTGFYGSSHPITPIASLLPS